MEYKVRLHLIVFNTDRSSHLSAFKNITLPFAPFVGLCIKEDGGAIPIKIIKSEWIIDEEYFYCTVTDEDEMNYKFDLDTDIDELTKVLLILGQAKKYGWEGFDKIYRAK